MLQEVMMTPQCKVLVKVEMQTHICTIRLTNGYWLTLMVVHGSLRVPSTEGKTLLLLASPIQGFSCSFDVL